MMTSTAQPPARIICALLAIVLALVASSTCAATIHLPLPEGSRAIPMGGSMVMNGVPTRATQFHSAQSPEKVAQWFRARLGQPYVEDRAGADLILGKENAGKYYTVKISPRGAGSRGLIAVADLQAAGSEMTALAQRLNAWAHDLGAGTKVLSHVLSADAGMSGETVVLSHPEAPAASARRIRKVLERRGFAFERETRPSPASAYSRDPAEQAWTVLFRSPGQEAVAVITPASSGHSDVVINTIIRGAK